MLKRNDIHKKNNFILELHVFNKKTIYKWGQSSQNLFDLLKR